MTREQKTKEVSAKTVELRDKFQAAHAKGMEALKRHDYDTFGNVIAEESQILDEQAALIDERRKEAIVLSREIATLLETRKKAKKKAKKKR